MAINIIQVVSNIVRDNNGSATTINTGLNFTAGSTVFFVCSSWDLSHSAVTIAGVAAGKDISLNAGSGDIASIWRAEGVPSGRDDVVTIGSTASYFVGYIIEVSGLVSGGPETSGSGGGTSNTPNITASSAATTANSLVLGAYSNSTDGSHATAATTGYTMGYATSGGEGGGGAYKIVSATGTHSITFTGGNNILWATIIASYAGTGSDYVSLFGIQA